MDRNKPGVIEFLLLLLVAELGVWVSGNVVFQVHHKFTATKTSLTAYTAHDAHRHRRILSAADLPLGGNGSPTSTALYFTKIQMGTPPRDYHVQVDSGSDLLWVNCAGCHNCPTKSDLGISLSLYDPEASSTAKMISCDHRFCTSDPSVDCTVGMRCSYRVVYGDGSQTTGYFIRDKLQLHRVSGNLQTDSMNGTIIFGCGATQSGGLGSSQLALDGILGLGQANSSIISQLALAKRVKRTFSHCLSGSKGGGIFAIGQVVHPKVKKTPMVPHEAHYNAQVVAMEVGDDVLQIPTDTGGAIIDSGTTLAYFPSEVYDQLMEKIMAAQPKLKPHIVDEEQRYECYTYPGNVDEGFPVVTFHFKNRVTLKVEPHQYFFRTQNGDVCIGFRSNGKDVTLLGDLVLTDKLVTYDMDDQTIGWTDYNCSSAIKVRDEESGKVYEVGAHDISRANANRVFAIAVVIVIAAAGLIN